MEWERRNLALHTELGQAQSLIRSSFICIKDLDKRVKALTARMELVGEGMKEKPFELVETPPPSVPSLGRLVLIERTPLSSHKGTDCKGKRRQRTHTMTPIPGWSSLLFLVV